VREKKKKKEIMESYEKREWNVRVLLCLCVCGVASRCHFRMGDDIIWMYDMMTLILRKITTRSDNT